MASSAALIVRGERFVSRAQAPRSNGGVVVRAATPKGTLAGVSVVQCSPALEHCFTREKGCSGSSQAGLHAAVRTLVLSPPGRRSRSLEDQPPRLTRRGWCFAARSASIPDAQRSWSAAIGIVRGTGAAGSARASLDLQKSAGGNLQIGVLAPVAAGSVRRSGQTGPPGLMFGYGGSEHQLQRA